MSYCGSVWNLPVKRSFISLRISRVPRDDGADDKELAACFDVAAFSEEEAKEVEDDDDDDENSRAPPPSCLWDLERVLRRDSSDARITAASFSLRPAAGDENAAECDVDDRPPALLLEEAPMLEEDRTCDVIFACNSLTCMRCELTTPYVTLATTNTATPSASVNTETPAACTTTSPSPPAAEADAAALRFFITSNPSTAAVPADDDDDDGGNDRDDRSTSPTPPFATNDDDFFFFPSFTPATASDGNCGSCANPSPPPFSPEVAFTAAPFAAAAAEGGAFAVASFFCGSEASPPPTPAALFSAHENDTARGAACCDSDALFDDGAVATELESRPDPERLDDDSCCALAAASVFPAEVEFVADEEDSEETESGAWSEESRVESS
mmetsp:Transcript_14164/g.30498  ORF Transcript_14164/g.30498 Transcript_14164/m.30498 type:complete len:384 (-) Transcript_14164:486-1637(-)